MTCFDVAPIVPASYSFKWFETRSAIARMKIGLSFMLSALVRFMPSWIISTLNVVAHGMTHLLGFLLNLDIELVQGLNVVGCECDRDQADILVTSLR